MNAVHADSSTIIIKPDSTIQGSTGERCIADNVPLLVPTTKLPDYTTMADAQFCWGQYTSDEFTVMLNSTYAEAVHWKMNLFKVPNGSAGKAFVSELARLFEALSEGSALESIAMKVQQSYPSWSCKGLLETLRQRTTLPAWRED